MIKRTQKISLEILAFSLPLLFSLSCTGKPTETDVKMQNPEISLWQCVEALIKSIPFTQKKVETIVKVPLIEVFQNKYTLYLEGYNALLAHRQKISKVDLRLANTPGLGPGFLVLNMDGACTTLNDVRLHYPDLEITDSPRGRSLNEVTSYTSVQPWGEISFSFAERNRTCLSSIALEPKSDDL